MKKLHAFLFIVSFFAAVSTSFGLDPILIGNFEDPISGGRYDNWLANADCVPVTSPAQAATLDSKSLEWIDVDGGWGDNLTKPFGEYGGTLEGNIYYQALLNPGAALTLDITAIPGEVTDYCTLELFANADGYWGTFPNTGQNVIIDGQPHTYVFYMTDESIAALEAAIGGWGFNLGWLMSTGEGGSTTLYVDNIWIYPDGPTAHLFPHEPSYDEVPNGDYSDITLKWKAAADPGDPNRLPDPNVIYAVHPDIVDEYIFMVEADASDPNLLYIGNTGIDPGTDDPNSSFLLSTPLPVNTAYNWAVVEAMEGYEQTLTPGVSTLLDVEPNNIIGPTWILQTRTTTPVIDTQPVSTRFGLNDASAQFTVDVNPGYNPVYQWFYSVDAVIDDPGDIELSSALGGDTDTLTITNHNKAYQVYYYCRVSNDYTVTGGGTEPDVYSDIVSLVVERKVAEYLFDGDLADSGDGNNGVGVGSPTFAAGVDGGSALSLNGSTQYVEIGDSADPNTFNKAFPRADLFTNVAGGAGTEIGAGGGLDIGSISCWVKLDATVSDQVSPILANGNAGWPHTEFKLEIPTDSAGDNTNLRTLIWGDDEVLTMVDVNPIWADPFSMGGDGQWHLLTAAWNRSAGTMKAYLDGNLLATWGADPSEYSVWDNTMTIGFDGTNYFGGLIDNLSVYNYELTAEDIVGQYYAVTGEPGCIYEFDGSNHNSNQLGSSYCRIDLADFADIALNWLNNGFYTPAP